MSTDATTSLPDAGLSEPVPAVVRRNDLFVASAAFAVSDDRIAAWQVISSLALFVAGLALSAWIEPWPAKLLMTLPMTAMVIRLFVLQHDAGHLALFSTKRCNDIVGRLLSVVPGIAYHAWRSEHNWHHAHQGKLDARGIDLFASPMTRREALADPEKARRIAKDVNALSVFILGGFSLLVARKKPDAFFMFRPAYRHAVPDRERLIKSVWQGDLAHALWNVLLIAVLGPVTWLLVYAPAVLLAGGIGAWLFFLQHHYEHTYFEHDGDWRFADAALQGASYMDLPWPLTWITATVGCHHVHHLNPRIPNYRLEAARRAIPELAAVKPLSWYDMKHGFKALFWDEDAKRLLTVDEALAEG